MHINRNIIKYWASIINESNDFTYTKILEDFTLENIVNLIKKALGAKETETLDSKFLEYKVVFGEQTTLVDNDGGEMDYVDEPLEIKGEFGKLLDVEGATTLNDILAFCNNHKDDVKKALDVEIPNIEEFEGWDVQVDKNHKRVDVFVYGTKYGGYWRH